MTEQKFKSLKIGDIVYWPENYIAKITRFDTMYSLEWLHGTDEAIMQVWNTTYPKLIRELSYEDMELLTPEKKLELL